jgi:hypothetical protein
MTMEFRDVFDTMFLGQPPREMTQEERYAAARRLIIAKYRVWYRHLGEAETERRIIEDIGQEDYARYGGIRVATSRTHGGQQREPD